MYGSRAWASMSESDVTVAYPALAGEELVALYELLSVNHVMCGSICTVGEWVAVYVDETKTVMIPSCRRFRFRLGWDQGRDRTEVFSWSHSDSGCF